MPQKQVSRATRGRVSGNGLIAANEVSVGDFREFVTRTGHRTDCEKHGGGWIVAAGRQWIQKLDASWDNPYISQEEQDPVVLVSWYDALLFANWRSTHEGLSPVYKMTRVGNWWGVELDANADGYRLPTRAEWESAARAGDIEISPVSAKAGRTLGASRIAGLPPSPWCSDGTAGHRFEWCWDFLDPVLMPAGQDFDFGRMPTPRCCGDVSISRHAEKEFSCCAGCEPLTAASTLGFRLVKGAPISAVGPKASRDSLIGQRSRFPDH